MSKSEAAIKLFDTRNCAQSVLVPYAADFDLDNEKALQVSVGFGGGFGRLQDICGAINGSVIVLGLASNFKEEDGREKINEVYAKVRSFIEEFKQAKGSIKCRELLGGCDLLTDEGQKIFKDKNLKEDCRCYVRLCCELLDKYLK